MSWTGEHTPDCAQLNKVPCPAGYSLHSEKPDEHWWSGWPGAYCMKCGTDDPDEHCIGTVCDCPCHKEFWDEYDKYMRGEESKDGKQNDRAVDG